MRIQKYPISLGAHKIRNERSRSSQSRYEFKDAELLAKYTKKARTKLRQRYNTFQFVHVLI